MHINCETFSNLCLKSVSFEEISFMAMKNLSITKRVFTTLENHFRNANDFPLNKRILIELKIKSFRFQMTLHFITSGQDTKNVILTISYHFP